MSLVCDLYFAMKGHRHEDIEPLYTAVRHSTYVGDITPAQSHLLGAILARVERDVANYLVDVVVRRVRPEV